MPRHIDAMTVKDILVQVLAGPRLMDPTGFEPVASCLQSKRSTADLRARIGPATARGLSANVNVRWIELVLDPPATEPRGNRDPETV